MRLDGLLVSETFQRDDPTFADVFDFEAGSDRIDGFGPLGAEVLARFFVALGRAADQRCKKKLKNSLPSISQILMYTK